MQTEHPTSPAPLPSERILQLASIGMHQPRIAFAAKQPRSALWIGMYETTELLKNAFYCCGEGSALCHLSHLYAVIHSKTSDCKLTA